MSKSLSAVGKWRESSSKNPSGEPAFRSFKALESLNGFEPSVELFVVAFDEIGCSWAAIVKELLRFHVACKKIAVVEDVVERGDLQGIIVVTRRSPADVPFQIFLAEVWKVEDLLFEIRKEASVRFLAADFQSPADVLEEMDVAELDDAARVDLTSCETDGFVVIADERLQVVAGVLEFREVLEHRREILRGGEQADRNIMRQVVDAVDEGNLSIVAFHGNELPVHDEEAAESLGVAVAECDRVVVRESIQFARQRSVGRLNALADASRERTGACTFEMQRQQWFWFAAMIDTETLPAIVTEVSFETVPRTFPLRLQATAMRAGRMASCSVFFGVDMFKVEKVASCSHEVTFSGTRNRTLSNDFP